MSNSVRPHRQQPTRLPRPWDSPGKNIGVGCHFLLQCMKVKSESEVAQSCPTLWDPLDCSLPGSSIDRDYDQWDLEKADGTPLQYSCLENPMDGGAWWAAIHRVARSWTRLSDFTFTFHFHALEKEMATHSNVFAWRIPWTEEPSGLPTMGSHRVGHDWSDLAAATAADTYPQIHTHTPPFILY